MECRIMVTGENIRQEIIGESLFDCVDTAYRNFRGQAVDLLLVKRIGYIDGNDLFVESQYIDRQSVKEIVLGNKHT